MNGIKTGLGITPGEHIISADSALSRNIRHCFCLSCHGRLILQTDAQGAWFDVYAFPDTYYELIINLLQSVELFCAYGLTADFWVRPLFI